MDSPESGWSYKMEKKRKGFSLSTWIIIALPLVTFLSVGIYFILADVKLLKTVVEKQINAETNTSEPSWWQASDSLHQSPTTSPPTPEPTNHPEETTSEDEDPNLIVRFDYVDLSSEDIPSDHFIHNDIIPGNNSRETIIILKNDDSGKKIFLKTSVSFPGPLTEEKDIEEATIKSETTTPKAFVYSPTIPQATPKKPKVDETTRKYNHTEDSGCFSTKIPFCEGILPYDVVQLPDLPGIKRYSDLTAFLPYFQMIVDSRCSLRAREFICSVLEPECQPEGVKQRLPCKLNCKVFSDDCKDYILETLPLSKAFDCRRYPDWDENQDCLNMFKGNCHEEEFRCSDGTCIPQKWVCDGVHDCPGSRPSFDESNCQGCSENEFRKGKNADVYGEGVLTVRQCQNWFSKFRSGNFDVEDAPRSGRPVEAEKDAIKALVDANNHTRDRCVMDGKCVPLHWKCDGQVDCVDHSDEISC